MEEGYQEPERLGVWGGESRKEEMREEEHADGLGVCRAQKHLAKEERGERKKEGEEDKRGLYPGALELNVKVDLF